MLTLFGPVCYADAQSDPMPINSPVQGPPGACKTALDRTVPVWMDDRSRRARTERMAVRPLGRGRYEVEGHSGNVYLVDLDRSVCTCPDHEFRDARCKHLRRVAIEITEGRVPPPGVRLTLCANCDDELTAPEGSPRPHLCADCRIDPGDLVLDRESGDPLIVVAVLDERADAVAIPGTGTSVASYPGNRRYPADDLVVMVIYPGSVRSAARRGTQPTRYAFPLSRLSRLGAANPAHTTVLVDADARTLAGGVG